MFSAVLIFGAVAVAYCLFLFTRKDWPIGHRIGQGIGVFVVFGFVVSIWYPEYKRDRDAREWREQQEAKTLREAEAQERARLAEVARIARERKAEEERLAREAEEEREREEAEVVKAAAARKAIEAERKAAEEEAVAKRKAIEAERKAAAEETARKEAAQALEAIRKAADDLAQKTVDIEIRAAQEATRKNQAVQAALKRRKATHAEAAAKIAYPQTPEPRLPGENNWDYLTRTSQPKAEIVVEMYAAAAENPNFYGGLGAQTHCPNCNALAAKLREELDAIEAVRRHPEPPGGLNSKALEEWFQRRDKKVAMDYAAIFKKNHPTVTKFADEYPCGAKVEIAKF